MTTIAFEFPKHAEKHPDVRVVMVPESYFAGKYTMVGEAYLRGCKNCQRTASECHCEQPNLVEKLLWDWQVGVLAPIYFTQVVPVVTEQKIKKLLPKDVERDEEGEKPQSRFTMPAINPELLQFWREHADVDERPFKIYLSAPPHDEADLRKFFEEMKQPFPEDFGFIDEGSRGGVTKRGGASARCKFPFIGRPHLFKQLEPYTVNGTYGEANNLRFALKMLFEHSALTEFTYKKK
jgi:hypothetical protein